MPFCSQMVQQFCDRRFLFLLIILRIKGTGFLPGHRDVLAHMPGSLPSYELNAHNHDGFVDLEKTFIIKTHHLTLRQQFQPVFPKGLLKLLGIDRPRFLVTGSIATTAT